MKALFSLLLALSVFTSAAPAFAGCNQGNFVCSVEGRRFDGYIARGQATTNACAGTQGVNVRGIITNLCEQALWQCVHQFRDERFGMRACAVTAASYSNHNGFFPQNDFIGWRLR